MEIRKSACRTVECEDRDAYNADMGSLHTDALLPSVGRRSSLNTEEANETLCGHDAFYCVLIAASAFFIGTNRLPHFSSDGYIPCSVESQPEAFSRLLPRQAWGKARIKPRKRQTRSLATPEIFVCRVGAKDDKNKESVHITFLSDLKKTKKRSDKKKRWISSKHVISEQADKESVKSREKCSL